MKEPGTQLTNEPAHPLAIIQAAVAKGVSAAELEMLVNLQERHDRNLAARAFGEAIKTFQAKCPKVAKKRTAGEGNWTYKFASYEDVMEAAGAILDECGIALSFSTDNVPAVGIKVTCRVRVGTHAEDHTLTVPVPNMKVNDTQKFGAALSYAKRYALCAALNIVCVDEDTDAQKLHEPVTDEQLAELTNAANLCGADWKRLLKWGGVTRAEDFPKAKFKDTMELIKKKASSEGQA